MVSNVSAVYVRNVRHYCLPVNKNVFSKMRGEQNSGLILFPHVLNFIRMCFFQLSNEEKVSIKIW